MFDFPLKLVSNAKICCESFLQFPNFFGIIFFISRINFTGIDLFFVAKSKVFFVNTFFLLLNFLVVLCITLGFFYVFCSDCISKLNQKT